eukprot:6201983-Pleurochrysis_carterae.AAC.2
MECCSSSIAEGQKRTGTHTRQRIDQSGTAAAGSPATAGVRRARREWGPSSECGARHASTD